MQTRNGWFGIRLVRVSLSQAQQLVMVQNPQSHRSILWKQTAGEGPFTCPGISHLPPWKQVFLRKSYQKQQDFSPMDLYFLFLLLLFVLNLPSL